jgi:SAM-dependent methyltransferase
VNDPLPARDADYFKELRTQTGWGRTLYGFALWCEPQAGWLTLDVGCGPGLLPQIFSKLGCKAMGIDLDRAMFHPSPLHPMVGVADIYSLPFENNTFDLITCSNLLFMLQEPVQALVEIRRLLISGGKLAMLNPSEHLNERAVLEFAAKKKMDGIASLTLVNWARRADHSYRWSEIDTIELYRRAGLTYGGGILKVGPGFGRFSWGLR